MHYRRLFFMLAVVSSASLSAFTRETQAPSPAQQMQNNLSSLRIAINNHENQLRQMNEKIQNLESSFDAFRDALKWDSSSALEQMQNSKDLLEERVSNLEMVSNALLEDIGVIKDHLNASKTAFEQYRNQLLALEKSSSLQNQNLENMQAALKSVLDALQASSTKESISDSSYTVKAGDTLEKIAQKNGTTIKALKELNHLTTDRIRVNQKLKLAEK